MFLRQCFFIVTCTGKLSRWTLKISLFFDSSTIQSPLLQSHSHSADLVFGCSLSPTETNPHRILLPLNITKPFSKNKSAAFCQQRNKQKTTFAPQVHSCHLRQVPALYEKSMTITPATIYRPTT